jgi:AraC family transcriptional regulator of adaptative response/methylated-DNA-[protein]-cysteine methyltransferase
MLETEANRAYENAPNFLAAFSERYGAVPGKADARPLFIEWVSTPLGRMFSICDETHLYMLEFTTRKNMDLGFAKLRKVRKRAVIPGRTKITDKIEAELKAYFEGILTTFNTPLAPTGTDFQNQVWKALQEIPYGQSCSYSDLAIAVGNEKAVRAVASSNANNGLALIIPCHRVIAKDGGLGGYAGGLKKKQWLLDHEKSNKP